MQTRSNRIRFIGADKLALVLIAITLILTALFWAMVVVAAGVGGANHVLASTGLSWIEDALIAIALLWVALRSIHYARRGASRALIIQPEPAAESRSILPAANDLAAHHP